MTVIHWHDLLQDLLDEHLYDLCGMKVKFASRELEKKVRYDYYCELDPAQKNEDDVYRPMGHLRRFNVIEFKSYHETFTNLSFYEYVGRLFQILGGAPKKRGKKKDTKDRWGKATLTIILARYPRAFFADCKKRGRKIVEERPWLYKVHMQVGLHIYVMVLPGLRKHDLGYTAALLQALEHDPQYQSFSWQKFIRTEEAYAESMKRIIMKINEEGFMTYLERVQKEIEEERQKRLKAEQEAAAYKQAFDQLAEQEDPVYKQVIKQLKEQLSKFSGDSGDLSYT